MPETVRADMTYASGLCRAYKFLSGARVAVWQLPKLYRRREYPIVRFTELAGLFPVLETIKQIVSEDESLGGTFRFAFILALHHDASADRDARLKPIHVRPSQPQTFAYAKSKANASKRQRSERLMQFCEQSLELLDRERWSLANAPRCPSIPD